MKLHYTPTCRIMHSTLRSAGLVWFGSSNSNYMWWYNPTQVIEVIRQCLSSQKNEQ